VDENSSRGNAALGKDLAVSLGNPFSVCAAGTTISQVPGDAIAMAATVSSHIISSNPGTSMISVTQAVDKHNARLQASLDKHWDDILCSLRTGSNSEKLIIPLEMLHKIQVANMTTMTKTNSRTACIGGKSLTTHKLRSSVAALNTKSWSVTRLR
jgi:hypothetical protein